MRYKCEKCPGIDPCVLTMIECDLAPTRCPFDLIDPEWVEEPEGE